MFTMPTEHLTDEHRLAHFSLRAAATALADAERDVDTAVRAARELRPPLTWEEIGDVLGMTKQAASQRDKRRPRA